MSNSTTFSSDFNQSSSNSTCAIYCPKCGSARIQTKNYGKKVGGTVGTCAGLGASLSGASTGASVGGALGLTLLPESTSLNGIASALLGAFAGAVLGCAAGAALGEVIDEKVLDNHECLDCQHSFQSV